MKTRPAAECSHATLKRAAAARLHVHLEGGSRVVLIRWRGRSPGGRVGEDGQPRIRSTARVEFPGGLRRTVRLADVVTVEFPDEWVV